MEVEHLTRAFGARDQRVTVLDDLSFDMGELFNQIVCAAFNLCPTGGSYPQPTAVTLLPIPSQPNMPNPCAGVPDTESAEAFCPDGHYDGPRGSYFGSDDSNQN